MFTQHWANALCSLEYNYLPVIYEFPSVTTQLFPSRYPPIYLSLLMLAKGQQNSLTTKDENLLE